MNYYVNTRCNIDLVTDIVESMFWVTVAGLAPRLAIQVPVSIRTLITKGSFHTCSTWALAGFLVTETGASSGTLCVICASPVTRTLLSIQ